MKWQNESGHWKNDDFNSDEEYSVAYEQARVAFFENPVKDGSKTRTRHHTGLIAQEVKQAVDDSLTTNKYYN